MADVEICLGEVMSRGVVFAAPLPVTREAGNLRELIFLEARCLAHLLRCKTAAIADEVDGHRRTELAITLIHILDGRNHWKSV